MRECVKCNIKKDADEFRKCKSGNRKVCKKCENEQSKLYKENNKEHIREHRKTYRQNNKEKIREYNNKYNKIFRKRKRSTITGRLNHKIQVLIRKSFKLNDINKGGVRTHEILGCSFGEFKLYLESKFESWMTWENRGLYNGQLNYGWDIDHIIPLSSAKIEEDVIKLNHYTNLQPLCSYINRVIKKDNLNY